jgi:hypothetical protein
MSDLLGAWSLSGEPPCTLLGAADRRAMLAHLPGWPARTREISDGRLWLVAASEKMLVVRENCLAHEGFLAAPGPVEAEMRRLLEAFAAGTPPRPEGHFALVHGGGELTLIRGLSGGERLYYAQAGNLLLFASALRPLLAHGGIGRSLNQEAADEVLLTGLTLFGGHSLASGVSEVLPGHILRARDKLADQRWHWEDLLTPLEGDTETLARECRDALGNAVALAAGQARPVAVTLSGGIDSSAIAALAVEAFGADHVTAFTYEFDDPTHSTETRFAVEVARRLGIRRHHIFKLGFRDYLAHIPETVWRAEQITHWPKSFMIPAAGKIRDHGFDRVLSGFGVGSHMGSFEEFARLLDWLPRPGGALGLWKQHHFNGRRWPGYLARLHPGLEPAPMRLYCLLVAALARDGQILDPASFFPDYMDPLLGSLADGAGRESGLADRPLIEALRHQSFARLASCIDVTRWEKPLRETGIQRISPAHFACCIPYCYMPFTPQPRLWSADRRLRPGKLLLRLAMRDTLPESVLRRRKNWADAVVSPDWSRAGLRWMRLAVGNSGAHLRHDIDGHAAAAQRWDRRSPQAAVTALGFWHRIFMEQPLRTEPPTWRDLLPGSQSAEVPLPAG